MNKQMTRWMLGSLAAVLLGAGPAWAADTDADSLTITIAPSVDFGVDIDTGTAQFQGTAVDGTGVTLALGATGYLTAPAQVTVKGNFQNQELEVVAAQVRGVSTVSGVNLFTRQAGIWQAVARAEQCGAIRITLTDWQLPELLAVRVNTDGVVPDRIDGGATGAAGTGTTGATTGGGIALPVVPEVC